MTPSIFSKLPATGTTIFTEMSVLAATHNAINLGQGFPDFMMSSELIALVNEAMKNGFNQYVHMNGLGLLRERIAEKVFDLYRAPINPESEITVTPGGTYAIYTALTAVLRPGDEVIVFEPGYDSYIPNIIINGATPIVIPMDTGSYSIDWALVKQHISPKTKMIMLNSPHNPTGTILGKADIDQLIGIVQNTGIFILSDEVYEHLVFDGRQHESMLRYPALRERSFVCFSFGKTYHCTGWKIGYCIAPAEYMTEFRKVHQYNCFSCNSPVQFALAAFLQKKEYYLELGSQVQKKRDHFQQMMLQTKFTALPSYGSYFQLYRYNNISDKTEREFSRWLTREHGVATIPLSAFYTNKCENKTVRFCFVKNENTLERAVDRLVKIY